MLVGRFFQAGKAVLELHHPRIGEQQCRVIARDQRARRHHFMFVAREIVASIKPRQPAFCTELADAPRPWNAPFGWPNR